MTETPRFAKLARTIIALLGADARSLLQGIITADVNKLSPEHPLYACLLTPQGKYLFDFFLADRGDAIWLDVASLRAEELVKKLTLYRLRSEVTIAVQANLAVYTAWGKQLSPTPENIACFSDPRKEAMGYRVVGAPGEAEPWLKAQEFAEVDEVAYHLRRIEQVVPEGEYELAAEKSFPLEYGLDNLGAIDFHKGCYVGQEVTARTKHRGVIRKRIFRVTAQKSGSLSDGAPVKAGENEIGELRSVVGPHGLALLRIEELEAAQATGTPITAATVPVKIL